MSDDTGRDEYADMQEGVKEMLTDNTGRDEYSDMREGVKEMLRVFRPQKVEVDMNQSMHSMTGISLVIVGESGSYKDILKRAHAALAKHGQLDRWGKFCREAISGDYSHLIRTCTKWFEIIGSEGWESMGG